MATHRIVALPGDGIGPEVTTQALRVLDRVERRGLGHFEVTTIPCAGSYYEQHGAEWPDGSFERCVAADAILLGAIGHVGKNGATVRRADGELAGYEQVIGLRTKLDLYANVRPVKLYAGVRHLVGGRHASIWAPQDVDMVILRENTEDAYVPGAFELTRGGERELVVSPIIITSKGAERVIRRAFELAMRRSGAPRDHTRRVTCVDKSNVIRAHRLFRDVFTSVARDFPTVEADAIFVDAYVHQLVREPERSDVVVAPNFAGDIVTDLGAALQGGMGMAASGNVGDRHAMFEPIHGSAPPLAGKGVANPTAAMLSVGLMLGWLGQTRGDAALELAAAAVDRAVGQAMEQSHAHTADLGGAATTTEAADAILKALDVELR